MREVVYGDHGKEFVPVHWWQAFHYKATSCIRAPELLERSSWAKRMPNLNVSCFRSFGPCSTCSSLFISIPLPCGFCDGVLGIKWPSLMISALHFPLRPCLGASVANNFNWVGFICHLRRATEKGSRAGVTRSAYTHLCEDIPRCDMRPSPLCLLDCCLVALHLLCPPVLAH